MDSSLEAGLLLLMLMFSTSDARYFSRAEVLEILNGTHKALTKEEMARFDVNQEVKEIKTVVEDGPAFRLPSG